MVLLFFVMDLSLIDATGEESVLRAASCQMLKHLQDTCIMGLFFLIGWGSENGKSCAMRVPVHNKWWQALFHTLTKPVEIVLWFDRVSITVNIGKLNNHAAFAFRTGLGVVLFPCQVFPNIVLSIYIYIYKWPSKNITRIDQINPPIEAWDGRLHAQNYGTLNGPLSWLPCQCPCYCEGWRSYVLFSMLAVQHAICSQYLQLTRFARW